MINLFEPSVSHRFLVSFFIGGTLSPVDISFQRVSGIGRTAEILRKRQGGDNTGEYNLPVHVSHNNIVLERGVMNATPLMMNFDRMLGTFRAQHSNIVILLLNHLWLPVCSWTVVDALPVAWTTGDLDANGNTILINTLELAYRDIHWMGVKA